MADQDTDASGLEVSGATWPPPPQGKRPAATAAAQAPTATLTPHAWLDLLLGFPTGFAGTLALFFFAVNGVGILEFLALHASEVGKVGPEQTSSEAAAELGVAWVLAAALSAAVCIVLVRRAPLFGIALTTGAVIALLIAAACAWLLPTP